MKKQSFGNRIWIGIKNVIAGIVIGVSNVIPGVSGGTMAVVMGVYDDMIDAVSIKRLRKNLFFIITLLLGMAGGILLFSNAIEYLFQNYPMQTNFTFLGLILGSIPMIFKRSLEERFRASSLIPFLLALGLMIVLYFTGNHATTGAVITDFDAGTYFLLVLAGFVSAFAMILPGISGSMIMVILGMYTTVISSVSNLNFTVLIPFGIGVVIGIVVALKLVKVLLAKWHQGTYFAILGLILGSLISLYPGFSFNSQGIVSIVLMIVAGVVAYLFSKSEQKTDKNSQEAVPVTATTEEK